MLCAPADLVKKSQALINGWDRYQTEPSFENFVELAVSINSFTEFLIDKGASALHHSSHQLEQVALALFSEEVNHPLSPAAWADLNDRIVALTRIIDEHVAVIESLVERRQDTQPSGNGRRASGVWLIGHDRDIWQDLLTQLDYFGMDVQFLHWDEALPEGISGDPLLLLDISSLPQHEWERRIKALRQQFAIGQLICLSVRSDFEQLQVALRMGCDGCQPEGTPLHTIVAQILELNERQEQEAFRVLIVEDSVTASRVIQHALQENQIIAQVITNPRQVLDTLRQFNPDLILMDMYMPHCTGVEAARIIRQHDEFLSIPIVYLSGETNVALQVDAMRLGGDHFLTKPFNPIFLNAIVKSKIERYRALRRSMYHDSLTGLLNHTSGKGTLDVMLSNVAHEKGNLSVAMLDIDHFKNVNDSYGHPVGDQIIRSLAWLLKQRLRKQNILCRYGGEEFLIGLPNTTQDQAYSIVDTIRHDFSQIRHPHQDSHFCASVSGGIASFPGLRSSDALIKAADDALYAAKKAGRNRIHRAP